MGSALGNVSQVEAHREGMSTARRLRMGGLVMFIIGEDSAVVSGGRGMLLQI
jgi:hypothetical protein